MPNSNIKVIQVLANTSMDYQHKILKEYPMLLKHVQLTNSLKMQIKYLSYLCKSATKINQSKFSIVNIIA